jgi:hypothetical protein
MATYTITVDTNYQALTAPAGNDTYNINGAKLTIDTDTRYCTNHTVSTGNLGAVTISSSLGGELHIDGTKVRIIPFNTGTGNVPVIGTTITQGGVTSYLLGVWSALNVAPTAAAAAMPTSGFIKVKNVSGGAYAAGALTNIGATATGPDIVGWIEVVGIESTTCTVPRLGTLRMTGEWFDAGTTTGVANQTVQLPASLANTYYPGVFIEETPGSGWYLYWPNAGSQTTVATDSRADVVWISTQGLLRIGNNGTANAGNLPPSGCKIVIPNIITINVTSAAQNTNAVPNATLATRYDFTTTGAGVIIMDKVNLAWYPSFAQAFSINIQHTGILEQLLISECASTMTLFKVGVGQTAAQSQVSLSLGLCFAGGEIQRCVFTRATLASSGNYNVTLTDINGFSFINNKYISLTARGNATTGNILANRMKNSTFQGELLTNGRMVLTTCNYNFITDTKYVDVINGTTQTTAAQNSYIFELQSNTVYTTISGVSFNYLTNVHPYLGILNIAAAGCDEVKLRNIGTNSSPLSLGSANQSAYLFALATGAAASNVKIQRCYVSNTRTGAWTGDNSSSNIQIENCKFDDADAPVVPMLNTVIKSVRATLPLTAQTSCYGTHFHDYFVSNTVGRVAIVMNEKTTDSLSSFSYNSVAGNPKFTSTGGLYMPVVGDSVQFDWSYYVKGHTSFANSAAVMAGGTIGNYSLEYAIDKGDGLFSSYKTLNGANLSAEIGIDPAIGFRLSIKITTSTTNTGVITSLYVITNTTDSLQGSSLHPSDTYKLNFTGLKYGSDVVILTINTTDKLGEVQDLAAFDWEFEYENPQYVDIGIHKPGYVPLYIRAFELTANNTTLPIAQVVDRNYQ